jgi:hypothetical protein
MEDVKKCVLDDRPKTVEEQLAVIEEFLKRNLPEYQK